MEQKKKEGGLDDGEATRQERVDSKRLKGHASVAKARADGLRLYVMDAGRWS